MSPDHVQLTGAQIRAARALLNMSVSELAERTGLAINTIRRAEGTNALPPITGANMNLLAKLFGECGVEFIGADDKGVGVRFAHPEVELRPHKRRRDKDI